MFKKLIHPQRSPQPGAGTSHPTSSPLPEVLPASSPFYPNARPLSVPTTVHGPAAQMAAALAEQPQKGSGAGGSGSPRSNGQVHVTAAVAGGNGAVPYKTVRNSIYRGGLINHSVRNGFGICKWEDGNYYEGEWKGEQSKAIWQMAD